MTEKQPTKRALQLRLRTARAMEKSLPERVRRAYGDPPAILADLPSDDPHLAEVQAQARASLLNQGYLTEEEIDTLPASEALEAAQHRLREQISSLQVQFDELTHQERGRSTRGTNAPRTLRQG